MSDPHAQFPGGRPGQFRGIGPDGEIGWFDPPEPPVYPAVLETKLEEIGVPSVSVSVSLDLNDYLSGHSPEQLYELLGKLKDLLNPPPARP